MDKELRDKGLAMRKDVLGAEYVERAFKTADEFNRPFQELVTVPNKTLERVTESLWNAIIGGGDLLGPTSATLVLVQINGSNFLAGNRAPAARNFGLRRP